MEDVGMAKKMMGEDDENGTGLGKNKTERINQIFYIFIVRRCP